MSDVRLQACLNGGRVAGVPVTPAELAAAAAGAVAAGADGVHVHPRGADGRESLAPGDVGAAVRALRGAGAEVGVTTGLWAAASAAERHAAVAAWDVLPGAASVNWHEEGAEALAALLAERGVGVEAGVWTAAAAVAFLGSPLRGAVRRVLVEATEDEPEAALRTAAGIVALLVRGGVRVPLLVHGEGGGAWPVLRWAAARGHRVRIGPEDTLELPDGSPAPSAAAQVAAARAFLR